MGVDVDEPRLDLGDALRIGRGLSLLEKGGALLVGLQHELQKGIRPARRFLRHAAHPRPRRQLDRAGIGAELALDDLEQRRLAGAVAAKEADARIRRQHHRGIVDEHAAGHPHGQVVDLQHGGLFGRCGHAMQGMDLAPPEVHAHGRHSAGQHPHNPHSRTMRGAMMPTTGGYGRDCERTGTWHHPPTSTSPNSSAPPRW